MIAMQGPHATGAPGRREPWTAFAARRLAAVLRGRGPAAAAVPGAWPGDGPAPGELVRVRPLQAILGTLGEGEALRGCAFAAVAASRCGEVHRVARPVRRFFDEGQGRMLRARNLVLLEGVTCDGSTYGEPGGCDRGCLLYWRTEWLEPLSAAPAAAAVPPPSLEEPWTWFALRRARGLVARVRHALRRASTAVSPAPPSPPGPLLAPGDRVRVRSEAAIRATLDAGGWRDGCVMGPGMYQHCGREFTVARHLDRFYDEAFGRTVEMRGVVALEDLRCDGAGHLRPGCDRQCVYFWRSEWLERIDR